MLNKDDLNVRLKGTSSFTMHCHHVLSQTKIVWSRKLIRSQVSRDKGIVFHMSSSCSRSHAHPSII